MKKVGIVGALWANNYGDVLLAKLLKDRFTEIGYSVVLPNSTPKIIGELELDSVNHEMISDIDLLVFCGGGYFSEPPGNSFKWALSRYKALFKYATYCRFKKIPYIIVGVGAGPLNSGLSKFVVKYVCKGARKVLVRDSISFNTIKKLSSSINLEEVADLVLSLKDQYPHLAISREPNQKVKKIGVHITVNASEVISPILRFVRENHKKYDFYLIEDNPGEYTSLVDSYPEVKKYFESNRLIYKTIEQFTTGISEFDFVITSKLHVGIVSAAFNKRVCSLPYHAKVARLYDELGRQELVLTVFDNEKDVFEHIKDCLISEPIVIPLSVLNKSRCIYKYIDSEFAE